jgi:integrase
LNPTPTFEAFYLVWRRHMAPEWKPLHLRSVDDIFRAHFLPRLGTRPVDQIDRDDVYEVRAELRMRRGRHDGPLAASTVNKAMVLLTQCMNEAALRYEFASPCAAIKRLKNAPPEPRPFGLDEVGLIDREIRSDYQDYVTTRFFTGMRTGEINGLRWRHVDLTAGVIKVRQTRSAGREQEGGKTAAARRDIPLLQPVREALERRRDTGSRPGDYVFQTPTGRPIDEHNFANRIWYPLLDRLGLEKRRPYETRHTTATLLLAAGENPEWIARLMGHANTQMLFTVYSRYVPNLTRADGTAIAALVARAWLAP